MTDLYLPRAAHLGRRIDEVAHRLAIVFMAQEASESPSPGVRLTAGWAVALVAVHDGRVLAWDGWYTCDPEEQGLPLDSLDEADWTEWDDEPSALLLERSRRWLSGPVIWWLAPTFSPAREAASLYASHFDSRLSSEAARAFRDSSVVAYLPLVDEDVLTREVERWERGMRSPRGIVRALAEDMASLDEAGN